jgi:hypothetical protein
MNKKIIPDSNGFTITPELLSSFAAPPGFFELSGPATWVLLVRLEERAYDGLRLGNGRQNGLVWFEENLL